MSLLIEIAMQIWPETITQLQCPKSSHLERDAANDGFSEILRLLDTHMWKLPPFSVFLSVAALHFLNTFLPSRPEQLHHAWEAQGTPKERNTIFFQTVREPLGMSCYSSPERRSHSVTNTGLIVSLITGEARHLSCFTLWGFSLKEPLLLIHHCQKYHFF